MIHSYAFSNFRSFLQRVQVPLTLTDKDSVNGWDRVSPVSGKRLTTALAVIGPNASGKTSLLQPLAFLGWFVRQSFNAAPDAGIPVVPHFNGRDRPTTLEIIVDGHEPESQRRYRLSVTPQHVVSESLEQRTRRGEWHPVFERERNESGKTIVRQNGFGMDQLQAEGVRPNVSLISWGAQYGVAQAQELATFTLVTNLDAGGRSWEPRGDNLAAVLNHYANNEPLQSRMRGFLARWDLGLADVTIREHEVPDASGALQKQKFAYGVHRDKNLEIHLLPFLMESSGTKAAFALLALFLVVLDEGGTMVFDELDSSLHPHLIEPLLDLFSSPETNPHHAQIIFTTQSTEVLRLLQKSQVMLVEKEGLHSDAWRLDSMEGVRIDDNRVAKYLSGAYGAVPRL